jgi:hypothetical protein
VCAVTDGRSRPHPTQESIKMLTAYTLVVLYMLAVSVMGSVIVARSRY